MNIKYLRKTKESNCRNYLCSYSAFIKQKPPKQTLCLEKPQIASVWQERLPVVVKTAMMLINPPQSTQGELVGLHGHEYLYSDHAQDQGQSLVTDRFKFTA